MKDNLLVAEIFLRIDEDVVSNDVEVHCVYIDFELIAFIIIETCIFSLLDQSLIISTRVFVSQVYGTQQT